jgi:hypothetical protein
MSETNDKLPETPSGAFAHVFDSIPNRIKSIVAIVFVLAILGCIIYVVYNNSLGRLHLYH